MISYSLVNLSGGCRRSILDQKLNLSCSCYLPATADLLPTGEIVAVEDSPFDLRDSTCNGKMLCDVVPLIDGGGKSGLDHCFLVDNYKKREKGEKVALLHVATLTDEISGRQLQCCTSMPAVQVYTSNWLPPKSNEDAPGTNPHVQHNAVCIETQYYPDSPNQPSFPSTILRPGEIYEHRTTFCFRTIT